MPVKHHDQRHFFFRQYRGMRLFRPHRHIMDRRPFLPFRAGFGIEVITCCQLGYTFLIMLDSRHTAAVVRALPCSSWSIRPPVRLDPNILHHHTLGLITKAGPTNPWLNYRHLSPASSNMRDRQLVLTRMPPSTAVALPPASHQYEQWPSSRLQTGVDTHDRREPITICTPYQPCIRHMSIRGDAPASNITSGINRPRTAICATLNYPSPED
jgi:hypothetical protein